MSKKTTLVPIACLIAGFCAGTANAQAWTVAVNSNSPASRVAA